MSRPTISFLTVTRNLIAAGREQAIAACFESLWSQDFSGCVEHIVQDGASDDGTRGLLEGLCARAPGHIATRLICEADSGLYDAMNKAAAASDGAYLLALNSDDALETGAVAAMLDILDAPDPPDFTYGRAVYFDRSDGSERPKKRLGMHAVLQRMPFCHNTMAVSRSVFDELGGYDTQFRLAGDYDFIQRLILRESTSREIKSFLYRLAAGGISSDHQLARAENAAVWRKNLSIWFPDPETTDETLMKWFDRGHFPMGLSWRILRDNGVPANLKRAAWHSFGKSLRRKMKGR